MVLMVRINYGFNRKLWLKQRSTLLPITPILQSRKTEFNIMYAEVISYYILTLKSLKKY